MAGPPIPAARQMAPVVPEIEDLYRAHHSMVFRTAYRVTGNAADAEDVLQTVFMRIWKRESNEIQNAESYLRRAAVNAALDVVRARQAAGQVPLEDMPMSAVCTELRELRDSLRKAIAKLNPKMAEIFALRFFEGHSNQDIAKMTGMSQVLVAVTLHRARKQLQKELKGAN
jgi:RNA polymerase sigma-70 factor (ECF subfamily)